MDTAPPPPPEASRSGDAGPADEFRVLRELIAGAERADLEALRERFEALDRGLVERVGEGLPAALSAHAARGPDAEATMGKALRGAVEEAVRASVAHDKAKLSDSLFPIMGPAIRSYVGELFKGMVENLNEVIRNTTSVKRIRWRAEAKLAGKPFSEYLLLKTARYRAEEVFLMERDTGLLLMHLSRDGRDRDADLVSGMFSAIRSFVEDSFANRGDGEGGGALGRFDFGEHEVIIEDSPQAVLAVSVNGSPPPGFRETLEGILEELHGDQPHLLDSGAPDSEPLRPYLERAMVEHQPEEKQGKAWPAVLILTLLAAASIGAFGWRWWDGRRAAALASALEDTKGIEAVRHRRAGWTGLRGWIFSGLRDPAADEPGRVAAASGFPAGRARFDFAPFHSAEPEFAAAREEAARQLWEAQSSGLRGEFQGGIELLEETRGRVGELEARERSLARALLETRVGSAPGVELRFSADGRSATIAGSAPEPLFSQIKAEASRYGSVFDRVDHDALTNATEEALDAELTALRAIRIRYGSGTARMLEGEDAKVAEAARLIGALRGQAAKLGLRVAVELRAQPMRGDNAEFLAETVQSRLADVLALLRDSGLPADAVPGATVDAGPQEEGEFGELYFRAMVERDPGL